MYLQSVWIVYKTVSGEAEARQWASEGQWSHRNSPSALTVWTRQSCTHRSAQLTRKLSCRNAYLFLKENCLLGSLSCYTGQAEVLTPDFRVHGGPNFFLREMLKLSEVLGNGFDVRLLHQADDLQCTDLTCSMQRGWFWQCHPDDLECERYSGLVGTPCSATSTRVVKSWNYCFKVSCVWGLLKSSLFSNCYIQDSLGVENERWDGFLYYPKANLEKKEYFTERTGFWKNQVTSVTYIFKPSITVIMKNGFDK